MRVSITTGLVTFITLALLLLLLSDRTPESRVSKPKISDAVVGARPTALSSIPLYDMVAPSPPPADLSSPDDDFHLFGCPNKRDPKLMAVGIITAPMHFDRRLWIRQKLSVSDARCRGVRVVFVLGKRNRMNKAQKAAIRHELTAHGDIAFVGARDWVPHAVAEKSLAWWQYAAVRLKGFKWYMKTDDDSLAYLPRLETDLRMMSEMGRSHYYYGVMTWRLWTPFYHEADAACGERGDDGPSNGCERACRASGRLKRLIEARKPGNPCEKAIGPFPFADGSLQILSSDLMYSFVDHPLTVNFSTSHLNRPNPPFWTHEDAGIAYLIFHTAMLTGTPITIVSLSPWKHNKFWINWFPTHQPSLPDEHVVNTHKVVTSMMAEIALDAYENTTYAADPFVCVDCRKQWGWSGDCHTTNYGRMPIEKFACCNKRAARDDGDNLGPMPRRDPRKPRRKVPDSLKKRNPNYRWGEAPTN